MFVFLREITQGQAPILRQNRRPKTTHRSTLTTATARTKREREVAAAAVLPFAQELQGDEQIDAAAAKASKHPWALGEEEDRQFSVLWHVRVLFGAFSRQFA
jgi:hypothetical protein